MSMFFQKFLFLCVPRFFTLDDLYIRAELACRPMLGPMATNGPVHVDFFRKEQTGIVTTHFSL
jgi:hypothetical protein